MADENFELIFDNEQKNIFDDWPKILRTHSSEAKTLHQAWEKIRRAFRGTHAVSLEIPTRLQRMVKASRFPNVSEEEAVYLSVSDVAQLFDVVVKEVVEKIRLHVNSLCQLDQKNRSVAPSTPWSVLVFLSGCVSEVPYVQTELHRSVQVFFVVVVVDKLCRGFKK
jgi:hypothetical protein